MNVVLSIFEKGSHIFLIDIQSRTLEKGLFSTTFFKFIFASFLVVKLLYRTRLRALHVKHVRSNLYEGPCIVLRREEPLFGSIFSLTPTKIGHFSIRNILDIYGSFLVVKLLYRTRLRAFHVKHFISSLYECCSFTFRRGESIFGSIFSLAFAKKGHFRQPFF